MTTARAQRRRTLAVCIPPLILLGFAARFGLSGAVADAAGGACYAALIYLLVALAFPAAPSCRIGVAALVICVLVEVLQLSSIPATLHDWFAPLRLIFGTSFAWADLPPYAIGAVIATALDRRLAVWTHGAR